MPQTLFDKIWDAHVVNRIPDGPDQLYIDRHYCHEVTSPQAFEGLRRRGIRVMRPERTVCSPDHNIPTINQDQPIADPVSRNQVDTLTRNATEFGVTLYGLGHPKNGIIHVIGPENGLTLPGQTLVCGDSHTSTHGALGAVAFGIGTSEVEMVLASQCIIQPKPKKMRITVDGQRHRPLHHRSDDYRRSHRLLCRICRRSHTRPVDGRAHDSLQPLHRDGSQRRHDSSRRKDI